MKQNVVFQVRLLAESPVANLALEGPGPVMDVHVAAKITRCWEGLGAQGTFMGLLLIIKNAMFSSYVTQTGINIVKIFIVFVILVSMKVKVVLPCHASFCGSRDLKTRWNAFHTLYTHAAFLHYGCVGVCLGTMKLRTPFHTHRMREVFLLKKKTLT